MKSINFIRTDIKTRPNEKYNTKIKINFRTNIQLLYLSAFINLSCWKVFLSACWKSAGIERCNVTYYVDVRTSGAVADCRVSHLYQEVRNNTMNRCVLEVQFALQYTHLAALSYTALYMSDCRPIKARRRQNCIATKVALVTRTFTDFHNVVAEFISSP